MLDYCTSASEIPTNINDVFIVPKGTTSHQPVATSPTPAPATSTATSRSSPTANSASLLKFYKSQLEARGWSLFSSGSSKGAPQSLFQKAGNDGFYWVVGITITKSTSDLSHWTFRIYQNSETV